jgi:SOS-response transcriptional repressor LexA
MDKDQERIEREERAARLIQARKAAGFDGPTTVSELLGINVNNVKAHEQGRNGFGIATAKRYAKAFKVSVNWLNFGIGEPSDRDSEPSIARDVPMIPWISAGALTEQAGITDFGDLLTIPAIDLPEGEWIALRVEGNSMDKISPPGSVIFANLKDKRLAPNACYVVADETGGATYKRYRPNDDPPFQPASYHDVKPPVFEGVVSVIGRVRRSIIDM